MAARLSPENDPLPPARGRYPVTPLVALNRRKRVREGWVGNKNPEPPYDSAKVGTQARARETLLDAGSTHLCCSRDACPRVGGRQGVAPARPTPRLSSPALGGRDRPSVLVSLLMHP